MANTITWRGRRRRTTVSAAAQCCELEKSATICEKAPAVREKKEAAETAAAAGEKKKAAVCNAFGHTFVLAPSFCLKMGCEDALLLSAFAKHEGLAILVSSELRATDRVVELLKAEITAEPADALLSADALLGPDAVRLLSEPNAGGASRVSEALSIEVLARAFGASLLQTECEIVYWPKEGSITDFSVAIDGVTLGVSVTRALGPPNVPFDEAAAQRLLLKKLGGVLRSTETCLGAWRKQILHVWAPTATAAAAIEAAYARLPHALVSDTVVLVSTVSELPQLFTERMSRAEKPARVPKGLKDAQHLVALAESDPCCGNGGRRRT